MNMQKILRRLVSVFTWLKNMQRRSKRPNVKPKTARNLPDMFSIASIRKICNDHPSDGNPTAWAAWPPATTGEGPPSQRPSTGDEAAAAASASSASGGKAAAAAASAPAASRSGLCSVRALQQKGRCCRRWPTTRHRSRRSHGRRTRRRRRARRPSFPAAPAGS